MTPQTFTVSINIKFQDLEPDCGPFKQPNRLRNYFKTCQIPDAKWEHLKMRLMPRPILKRRIYGCTLPLSLE